MAKTFVKGQLAVRMRNDAMLAVIPVYLPEKASETFKNGAPLIWSSGYLTQAATNAPCESVEYFALQDAHNDGSNGLHNVKAVPAAVGNAIALFGSFLTTAAADNALAAADLGGKVQLLYGATAGAGSTPIWYLGDSSSNPGAKIVAFECEPGYIPANQSELTPLAGDTNARVKAALLDSAADYAV